MSTLPATYNLHVIHPTLNRILLALGGLGLFVSGVLSYTHLAGKSIPCGAKSACDLVSQLPQAKWGNYPVAYYGFLGYLILITLAAARPFLPEKWVKTSYWAGLLVSGVGAGTSFYLMNLLLGTLQLKCDWCMASAAIMLTTFLIYGWVFSVIDRPAQFRMLDKVLVPGILMVSIFGFAIYATTLTAPMRKIVTLSDPTFTADNIAPSPDYFRGAKDAKVTVIEFADFFCPACRASYRNLDTLLQTYPGRIRVAFRHLPLFNVEGHEMSLPAAVGSEIARNHGKFWEYVDAVYSENYANTKSVSELVDLLVSLGVDRAEAQTEITDSKGEAFDTVAKSVDMANKLGINVTPSYVVLGQGLQPRIAGTETVQQLLQQPDYEKLFLGGPIAQ